ncbi:hypothetical protein HR12_44600, partial [Microbacterium sp. SUBG005]
EHIVSTASIYSGTRVLFDRTFARLGVTVEYVWNPLDEAEWDALIRPETKAIFTETLPNPRTTSSTSTRSRVWHNVTASPSSSTTRSRRRS